VKPRTARPKINITKLIPDLEPLGKTTTRLHPKRGQTTLDSSKIGGLFLWSEDKPLPCCPDHATEMIGLLQLRAQDVPLLEFPYGDLLQLFWCPREVKDFICCMNFKAVWQTRKQVKNSRSQIPVPPEANPRDLPIPCVLHPEQVREYPHVFEIDDFHPEIMQQLEALCQNFPELESNFSEAPEDDY
jgi:uncharacterized protein YwqG